MFKNFDVIVIGAGAAGLMAASTAGKRGRKVLLIEHTNKIGEKIRISGGGRCNFTNLHTSPKNYISENESFAISALKRYSQHNFIELIDQYKISYHEKTLGQLFCDGSSTQIVEMLRSECLKNNVTIALNCLVSKITQPSKFEIETNIDNYASESLIIATGGLSIPKLGATNFGYQIAKQFNHKLIQTRPALVPLTVSEETLNFCQSLSGLSISSVVNHKKISFKENILFTHRGLSGPAILQISSYCNESFSDDIYINLLPEENLQQTFIINKNSNLLLSNFLKNFLPNRFIDRWCESQLQSTKITDAKLKELERIAYNLHNFKLRFNGSEGYAKAEVTRGGVNTLEISSKTMESNHVKGLFFIGEVVDVTGWLGGYNFQWAWSSGFAAGQFA